MAATLLLDDLRCHICRKPYTDAVALPCGHRFCSVCIARELDTQERSRAYSCPKCKAPFHERPATLHKKRRLCEEVPCTYCDGCVPAEKTCLLCEASLCAKHLTRHSNGPEHLLIEPTAFPEGVKCAEHRQVLDHICTEDDTLICLLCYLSGAHKGHEVAPINTNCSTKGEKNLKLMIKTLRTKRRKIDSQIGSLRGHEAAQARKMDAAKNRVIGQIFILKKELDALQTKVLTEVYAYEKDFSASIADRKKNLEEQREELSQKVDDFEELRDVRDPLTFLKKTLETDLIGIFDDEPNQEENGPAFDETPTYVTLHRELLKFADDLNGRMLKDAFPKMIKSEVTLDKNTAHCNIVVEDSLGSAFYSADRQTRDACPGRFWSHQVLSRCSFSSGNHYWEVEVQGTHCSIGVAYEDIERKIKRHNSRIGYNSKSWSLSVDSKLRAWHNEVKTDLNTDSPVQEFGIFLEYDAGRLTFYQLCDPIRHLHTFTTVFTKTLHAAFYIFEGSRITIRN